MNSTNRITLTWMIREIALTGTGIEFDDAALARDGISLPSPSSPMTMVKPDAKGDLEANRALAPENYVANLDKRYKGDVAFTYRVPKKTGGVDIALLTDQTLADLGLSQTRVSKSMYLCVNACLTASTAPRRNGLRS